VGYSKRAPARPKFDKEMKMDASRYWDRVASRRLRRRQVLRGGVVA